MIAPMAESRRNRPSTRSAKPSGAPSGPPNVDDETAAALKLFNSRLAKQADDERAAKRVERATRAKDAAAARVRELESDTKATAEQRSEAAAEYHGAVEALDRARKGEPDPPRQPALTATPSDEAEPAVQPEDDASGEPGEPADH
jgi:hypothetical protein